MLNVPSAPFIKMANDNPRAINPRAIQSNSSIAALIYFFLGVVVGNESKSNSARSTREAARYKTLASSYVDRS